MTPRATLSPAWLGVFALATFGGLVVASFASGYHLVMKSPRAEQLVPAAEPPAAASGEAEASPEVAAPAADSSASPAALKEPPAQRSKERGEAVVRRNLPPNRALVWAQPESKKVVGRLPSKQRVAVLERQDSWVRVEFKRRGKQISGWTLDSNLQE